jgi:isopenicillin N synthase-like dioxygenase
MAATIPILDLGSHLAGEPGARTGGRPSRPGARNQPSKHRPIGDQMTELAIIDIGPYLAGEKGAMERCAEELRVASETLGFYFVANHGIDQKLIDRVFAEAERFHHLPLEEKDKVKAVGEPVGYLGVGGQTQRAEMYGKRSAHRDRSASYYVRNEFAPDHPDRIAKKPWVFENKWPDDLTGFRETCLE